MQTKSDPVVDPCCSWIHWSPYYSWVCTTSSSVDRTNIYDFWDKCRCLPVKGDFVSEIPLTYKPVNNIIAHVGFSSFHAFNIYAAFGRIKVVLHHWSCWRILPIEFISNLFPETWKEAIVCISATGCTDKHRLCCARKNWAKSLCMKAENFRRCTNKTCVLDLPSGFSRDFLYSAR